MRTETNTDAQEQLRCTVEQLLFAMCEKPKLANLRLLPSDHHPVLVFTCDRIDYGAILGKKRAMLDALKLLVSRLATAKGFQECRFVLDDENCSGERCSRTYVAPTADWDSAYLEQVATLFCSELFGLVQVHTERVSSRSARVTVTVTGIDGRPQPAAQDESSWELARERLERALEQVFNCVGALSGKKILCELVL